MNWDDLIEWALGAGIALIIFALFARVAWGVLTGS